MTTYLLRPDGSDTRRSTILAPCGFDSTAEAGYAATGYMALPRGHNILFWDGPGQGGMLYEYGVPMRPDFESVVSPVINWLLEQPGVDPKGLVLLGRSFAGYLAPRAASFEHRLAALVCDPGQVEFVSRIVPAMFDQAAWARILSADSEMETALQRRLEDPRNGNGMVRGWLQSVPKRWASSFACNPPTPFWIAYQGFAVRPWSRRAKGILPLRANGFTIC
jgi:hypothetical protein